MERHEENQLPEATAGRADDQRSSSEEDEEDGLGDVAVSTEGEEWDDEWERKMQEHLQQRSGGPVEADIGLEAKWSVAMPSTTTTTTRSSTASAAAEETWWHWWAAHDDGNTQTTALATAEQTLVTADGGVTKRMVHQGTGLRPVVGCKVAVSYVGRLLPSRELFDQAHASKPLLIELGKGECLPGMEAALIDMKKGEEAEITLSSDYAYGDVGCPPRIPPRSQVQFLLRFLYTEWPAVPSGVKQGCMLGDPLEVRMANAHRHREAGNDLFRLKAYRKAVRCYNKAMSTFNGLHGLTEEEQTHLNTCLLPLHANLAAALYQLKDYPKAIDNARKALSIDSKHEKALYRLGLAHEALHDHDEAQEAFRRLASMRPDSVLYKQALVRIHGIEREALKHSIFVGLFDKRQPLH